MKPTEAQSANTRKSCAILAGALLLCLCALLQLEIGAPVPVTLHNAVAVMLGVFLGPTGGAAAVGLFFLAGAAGLPVFPGWLSGLQAFSSVTGGYLTGYFVATVIAGLCTLKLNASDSMAQAFPPVLHGFIAGTLCSYITAILAYKNIGGVPFVHALILAFVPFLLPDAVKLVLFVTATAALRKKAAEFLAGGMPGPRKEA